MTYKTNYQTALIIVLLLLSSCASNNTSTQKYQAETRYFDQYLQQQFNSGISADSNFYFVISESGCAGNVSRILGDFIGNPKAVFVMSRATHNRFLNNIDGSAIAAQILLDSTEKVNRIPYHKGNVGLILSSRNHIDSIITIEPVMWEQQVSFIK